MKIINDNEQSLDDLVVKARKDPKLKQIIQGEVDDDAEEAVDFCGWLAYACGKEVFVWNGKKDIHTKIFDAPSAVVDLAWANGNVYCLTIFGDLIWVDHGQQQTADITNIFGDVWNIYAAGNFDAGYGVTTFSASHGSLTEQTFFKFEHEVRVIAQYSGYPHVLLDNGEMWNLRERRVHRILKPEFAYGFIQEEKTLIIIRKHQGPHALYHGDIYEANEHGIIGARSNHMVIEKPANAIARVPTLKYPMYGKVMQNENNQ